MVLGLLQDTNNSMALWGTLEISGLFWCHLHWMKFYETKKFWSKLFSYSLWKYPKSIKAIDPGIIFYLVSGWWHQLFPFPKLNNRLIKFYQIQGFCWKLVVRGPGVTLPSRGSKKLCKADKINRVCLFYGYFSYFVFVT